ncbi:hypothetical protein ACIHCQ_39045 [Streptomyces sp. NPDC052236]|uniref:hypothetical protein n=1 Tax=Streptomyces sp. NPDC052236 TaxID=3365686 RepID=UPI0037CE33A7
MRLRDQRETFPPTSAYLDGEEWPARGDQSVSALSPDDMGDWVHMFTLGVQVPDLFCRPVWGKKGAYRLWLFDMAATSWATADFEKDRTEYDIVQSGPRRLWNEAEAVMRWYKQQGEPGFDRYGLAVSPQGRQIWLDNPGNLVPVRVP